MEPKLSTQDINGKDSAKRKWASRLLWITILSYIFYFIISVSFSIFVYYTTDENLRGEFKVIELMTPYLKEMWIWIAIGGFASLGLTIFEFLNNYFKK